MNSLPDNDINFKVNIYKYIKIYIKYIDFFYLFMYIYNK